MIMDDDLFPSNDFKEEIESGEEKVLYVAWRQAERREEESIFWWRVNLLVLRAWG